MGTHSQVGFRTHHKLIICIYNIIYIIKYIYYKVHNLLRKRELVAHLNTKHEHVGGQNHSIRIQLSLQQNIIFFTKITVTHDTCVNFVVSFTTISGPCGICPSVIIFKTKRDTTFQKNIQGFKKHD